MARTSVEDIKSVMFLKAVVAEFIGTFFLVLVGCGSCSSFPYKTLEYDSQKKKDIEVLRKDPTDVVQIAFCFGLAVATIVWSVAHVSGGHINPAVSIAFFITRKISVLRFFAYVVAQVLGGIVAAFLLSFLTPPGVNDSLCSTLLHANVPVHKGLLIEFLVTFILVWTVFATCDTTRDKMDGSGPLAIGLSVTICHMWAVPYTGSSMNPARALASHVASNNLEPYIWIYWVGPLLGGIAAGLLYDLLFAGNSGITKTKGFFKKDYDDSDFDSPGKAEDSFK